ncbi:MULTISPECIES: hypothetical protein [unclassified Acinetobacter]|uniref:type IV pilus assembly protein FimV n=1 Tax=unclassified Acinetobacter TaxID=196816 RepID=UPI002934889A|nr:MULTISPECIES: hypothetical protein [unclassified Acinetobacter]WOE31210.1 hypothetical protein QSG84_12860 [Acinetobacter sp. SAAs470]WOE39406.1 hypothetical protein QSG86_06525 [Acinetobacter sp. SAAs474]
MNNKQLYITIFTIFLTQNIHAIQIDPLQIQSSLGEVLYAEMMVHTDSHHLIEASIATEDDLKEFAIEHHPPPHLNIYIRQNHSSGGGVITLTSTQPITRPELNLVIKIKAGNDIKLQHIQQNLIQKKPAIDHDANFLTPQQADEKFFSVDLPKPIPHDNPANNIDQQPSNIAEQKLAFSSQYPPVLNQPTPLNRNDDKRANSPSVVTPLRILLP